MSGEQCTASAPSRRVIVLVLNVVLGGLLALVAANRFLVSTAHLDFPYPNEYRDGALVDVADQFSKNRNPYTLENTLPHTYVYGFLSPLLDSVLGRVVSCDLGALHRAVTVFCITVMCLLLGVEVFSRTRSVNLVLLAVAVVLNDNFVTPRPEPLALLLTVAALYIANNARSPGLVHALALSVLSVLLFHVKPYFVMVFGVLSIYLVFTHSKRMLLQFVISFLVLFVVSAGVAQQAFPLYFPNAVMNNLNMYNTHKVAWMLKQTVDFARTNPAIVIAFLVTVGASVAERRKWELNLRDLDRPLLTLTPSVLQNPYFVYGVVALAVLTFMMGQHTGTYLTYYRQLLPIPLLAFSLTYGDGLARRWGCERWVRIAFICLFLFDYRDRMSLKIPDHQDGIQAWAAAIRYIEAHEPSQAYLSPHFTAECVSRNWPVYDNGQTDTFYAGAIFDPRHKVLAPLFPYSQFIPARWDEWKKGINEKVSTRQFSLIAVSSEYKGLIDGGQLESNYTVDCEMDLPINLGHIEFWLPRK